MLIDKCRFRMCEIADAFDKDNAEVVSLYEQAKDVARANNMLTREKIHSKHMYVDTGNRYEDGIVPSDVTDLISNIFKNGFRHEHLLMPTCAECPPPNTPAFDAIKRFDNKNGGGLGRTAASVRGQRQVRLIHVRPHVSGA